MRTTPSVKWLFGAWIVQGVIAFIWLLLIPTDAENGTFLGFTPARLLLLGGVFGLILISIALFFFEHLFSRSWLNEAQNIEKIQDGFFVLAFFVSILSPVLIFILHSLPGGTQYDAYAERLTPLSVWLTLAGVEFILYIMYIRREQGTLILGRLDASLWRTMALVFAGLLLLVWLVARTRIGITPDYNMGAPAIPLWEWQILLIALVLTGLAFLPEKGLRRWEHLIAPAVYLVTVVAWLSQPINPAYTATPPRAPNFEIYPFSDPQIYSQYAQAALVGNGFLYPDVPSRAFYVAFLTWAHWLGFQNYNIVIILQTLMLAFFPVSLYLIGRELGGRAVGIGLAAMPLFRDLNSNVVVPFASNVTYSKLLLSELPLALFLGYCIWIVIRWLKYDQRSISLPIVAGGLLGAAALVRTQSVALIPVIALIAFLVMRDKKQWLVGMLTLGIALTLTLAPWLVRNYVATGGLVVDNPVSQMMTMARRWNGSWGNETLPRLPDETDAQYSSRMTVSALDAFRRDPQYILRTAANHFINSEIASLMAFPLRSEIRSLSELGTPQFAFWTTNLKPHQLPLFTLYLVFLGIGLAAAIRRMGWLGVLPLFLGLTYNLWTALFFSSGERFIVPLDWTVYFYQLFGLIALGVLLLGFTKNGFENASAWTIGLVQPHLTSPTPNTSQRQLWFAVVVVVLLAIFTPLTEFIFPVRYTPAFMAELEKQAGILPREGESVIIGRANYPRYYFSGEGEPDTAKLGYAESEEPRLIFFVAGSSNDLVIFSLDDAPAFFPHASDVYLVGEWSEKGYFSPRAAYVLKGEQSAVYQLP